ncbi:MAG TPA: polysaccharide deacetylase family protein [Streptosporangiaceae bacterium]
MWVAGIGWQDDHYCAVVRDDGGHPVVPLTVFAATEVGQVVALLKSAQIRSGGRLASVIDSVSGVLERHLVEAGLAVYRADPGLLAGRSAGSSAPAEGLAAVARAHPSALCQVTLEGGAMSGRDQEVTEVTQASANVERTLAAAGRLVLGGNTAAREIALTFDDGPSPVYTGQVLDVLGRYGAAATFFCIGLNAHAFPEMVERIAADGHEIGNHTWSHPYLPDLSRSELNLQLDRTTEVLAGVTGRAPALFRPPYGGRSAQVLRWLAEAGMSTVLWNTETSDWARPGQDVIEGEVAGQAGPGSIVLFHDGGGDRSQTVAALPGIMDHLCEQGYRFVPVSRFLTAKGP